MKKAKSLYLGHRLPAAVIGQAVRWYFRFQLSLRDIEELLFERGVTVTYETIRCWCAKFGEGFAHRVKAARRKAGSTWHLDEMFVTLRGEPYLLWRAVDEHGAELDILLQKRRDKATVRRVFKRVMRSCPTPRKIVIDQLRSYSAAKAEIPELASVKHVFVKAAARVNNRAENSHNQRVNVSVACVVFETQNVRRNFLRASGRSGNISRSSGICCTLHCIANCSQQGSLTGANSLNSPKIRRLVSKRSPHLPPFRLMLGKPQAKLTLREPVIQEEGVAASAPAELTSLTSWLAMELRRAPG
ncbi:IS6 family transposase [Paraburkholderia sp. RL17-337-BIB-A]|uniref:IS6 family transposase n=1 Tax=Paraburkholderia sp. RL17-337-BIB-A TaxID=3031636 RepID=UPI0038BC93D3